MARVREKRKEHICVRGFYEDTLRTETAGKVLGGMIILKQILKKCTGFVWHEIATLAMLF